MHVTYQGAYFVPTSAPPAGLLLDNYPGSILAFSTARKLRTAYAGNCLRVRRSTDNAELDIGFTGTDINEAAITAFNPGGDCFIAKVYAQDGSGNFLYSAGADQPQIMATGTLIKVNGKLAGLNGYILMSVPISAAGPNWSFFQVSQRLAGGNDWCLYGDGYNVLFTCIHYLNDFFYSKDQQGIIQSNSTDASTNQNLITSIRTALGQAQYLNGVLIPSTNTPGLTVALTFNSFGDTSASPFKPTGYFQEGVFYLLDQTGANQTGIEANQRVYYGF